MTKDAELGGGSPSRPNLFAVALRSGGFAARLPDGNGRSTLRSGGRPAARILSVTAHDGATVAEFALKAIAREARRIEAEAGGGAKSARATCAIQHSALVISAMRMNHMLFDIEAAAGGCARINLRRPGSPERDVLLLAFIDHSALLARIYRNAADDTNWFVLADAPVKVARQTILADAATDSTQPGAAIARLAGWDADAILSMCAAWADLNAVLTAALGQRPGRQLDHAAQGRAAQGRAA